MKETWRWFGSLDKINLSEIAQTGAKGIVTSLHEIPYGQPWSKKKIKCLKNKIVKTDFDFNWDVVESLPVHENIKIGKGDLKTLFKNYRVSLENLAEEGIKIICYNFMPLLDWTRTHLDVTNKNGSTALRFSAKHMAAFEIKFLNRKNASEDYHPDAVKNGIYWFNKSTIEEKNNLLMSIMAGLPGSFERYSVKELQQILKLYKDINKNKIRKNYGNFLNEILPTAEKLGIRMCVHPDDPPRNILGLPRILSNSEDINWVLNGHCSKSNGLTLCSGSLGAGENDVLEIAKKFADKIFFAHIRNVKKEYDGSFQESDHLDGDTNIPELLYILLNEEERRKKNKTLEFEIPFRPDHGHKILNDFNSNTHPGYPLLGRMKGLSELRGVIASLKNCIERNNI